MHPNMLPPEIKPLDRRSFLKRGAIAASATALFTGLPKGWVGGAYASDAPEAPKMNFGNGTTRFGG